MKRAVITGGTGFVGANLARRLLADGHDVHLLVRPGYTPWRIEGILNDVRLHEVQLADPGALEPVIAEIRPDWVFHLAAHGAHSWQTDLRQIVETNMVATINLVEACMKFGFEAFINTGSSSEYGFKDHAPAEDEMVDPNSHYAVMKASATQFCRYTAKRHAANITTLRLYSVYGPYEEPHRLMPSLIVQGLNGRFPHLVDPDTARDFVYVDDVCEAYILAVTCASHELGAIYNVGSGVQTALREVVEISKRNLDIAEEPSWGSMAGRVWDTKVWVADNRKIRAELKWIPRFAFEAGFRLMVKWFRENPEMAGFYQNTFAYS